MPKNINLITRLSVDKDFFCEIADAFYDSFLTNNHKLKLVFVGAIEHQVVYEKALKHVKQINLEDHIFFTKKSIRFNDMDEEMKSGYFLNLCIGDFVGYSSIESIKMGFKTFFLNIDSCASNKLYKNFKTFNNNASELSGFFNEIVNNTRLDEIIKEENKIISESFHLSNEEKNILLSTFG